MFFSKIFNPLISCFHSGEFYKNLYFNGRKRYFFYMLLVLAISNLVTIIPTYNSLKQILNQNSEALSTIEKVEINDKKLKITNKTLPIKLYDKENLVAIIDAKNSPDKYLEKKVPIVFSKEGVFLFFKDSSSYQKMDLGSYTDTNTTLNDDQVQTYIKGLKDSSKSIIFGILYPIITLITLILVSLKLLFFSFLGFIYGKINGVNLVLSKIIKVSFFAIIPSLTLQIIYGLYLTYKDTNFLNFYQTMNGSLITNLGLILFLGYFFAALDTIRNQIKLTNK